MLDRNGRVCAVVRRIPRGRVASYGQVAAWAGLGRQARQVGYALHALPKDSDIPWHRVVNAQGRVSPRSAHGPELEQRIRLELEGVRFDAVGRVAMERFRWLEGPPVGGTLTPAPHFEPARPTPAPRRPGPRPRRS
jgi:methylated-DNA-protein-cysteine methyltransferase related protein